MNFFQALRRYEFSEHVLAVFLPARRYASAVCVVIACSSVCPSVCSSQAGIVSKQLNIKSQKQRWTIAREREFIYQVIHNNCKINYNRYNDCSLWCNRFLWCSSGITPNGAPYAGGVGKHCVFRPVEKSRLVVEDHKHCLLQRLCARRIACSLCDSWAYSNVWCAYKTMQVVEEKAAIAKSAPQTDTWPSGLRYSYNSRTIFQLIQSVARVSRR